MKLFCDIMSIVTKNADNPFTLILTTTFFNLFLNSPIELTYRIKFDHFGNVTNNTFLSESNKEDFIKYFCYSQKINMVLKRFFLKYVLKSSRIVCDDSHGNCPFSSGSSRKAK
jgi:hypothetical protein